MSEEAKLTYKRTDFLKKVSNQALSTFTTRVRTFLNLLPCSMVDPVTATYHVLENKEIILIYATFSTSNLFKASTSSYQDSRVDCRLGYIIGDASFYFTDSDSKGAITNGFAIVANLGISMAWGPVQTLTIETFPTVIR